MAELIESVKEEGKLNLVARLFTNPLCNALLIEPPEAKLPRPDKRLPNPPPSVF